MRSTGILPRSPSTVDSDPMVSSKSRYAVSEARLAAGETEDAELEDHGSQLRKRLGRCIESLVFQHFMHTAILLNVVVLIPEIDSSASQAPSPVWRSLLSKLLMAIFVGEITLRLFVHRTAFFHVELNVIDFGVVALDVIAAVLDFIVQLPPTSILRMLRLTKLLRTQRLLKGCYELEVILAGMKGTAKTMVIGLVLVIVVLLIWSMIAVEVLHPIGVGLSSDGDCDDCSTAYKSVGDALVSLVQLVLAGDGFGQLCLPFIQKQPGTLIFFVLMIVSMQMGLLNLILSAIVDGAHERRLRNRQMRIEEKNAEYEQAKRDLFELCLDLDRDKSGALSLAELQNGYTKNGTFFDIMHVLDVELSDLNLLFGALDRDRSSIVSYDELTDELHKLKTQEERSLLIFVKCQLCELKNQQMHTEALMKDMQMTQKCLLQTMQQQASPLSTEFTPSSPSFQALAPSPVKPKVCLPDFEPPSTLDFQQPELLAPTTFGSILPGPMELQDESANWMLGSEELTRSSTSELEPPSWMKL